MVIFLGVAVLVVVILVLIDWLLMDHQARSVAATLRGSPANAGRPKARTGVADSDDVPRPPPGWKLRQAARIERKPASEDREAR
jgi:hypothetical protein